MKEPTGCNPAFIPLFHWLVLDAHGNYRSIALTDLPANWQDMEQDEATQRYLLNWLQQPNALTMSVPSVIVDRFRNYLLHTLHPHFTQQVRIVENVPFRVDTRVTKNDL